eukprot:COSAG03_NODE_8640_length_784_cov_1.226277_2_plen_24_part_01
MQLRAFQTFPPLCCRAEHPGSFSS